MFSSKFFQKQIIYFRDKYISSLDSFNVKVDPERIKKETYLKITENHLKARLDLDCKKYNNHILFLKKHREICFSDTQDEQVSSSFGKENMKFNLRRADILIENLNKTTKLYLISLGKNLTIIEAKEEIKKMGFYFPSCLETILFIQEHEKEIPQLPIVSLDANLESTLNENSIEHEGKNCIIFKGIRYSDDNYDIDGVGNAEFNEQIGYSFKEDTLFLVKAI